MILKVTYRGKRKVDMYDGTKGIEGICNGLGWQECCDTIIGKIEVCKMRAVWVFWCWCECEAGVCDAKMSIQSLHSQLYKRNKNQRRGFRCKAKTPTKSTGKLRKKKDH